MENQTKMRTVLVSFNNCRNLYLGVPLLACWCMTSANIFYGPTLGISVLFSLAHFQISRFSTVDNIVVIGVFWWLFFF